jgi:hypothetical protein
MNKYVPESAADSLKKLGDAMSGKTAYVSTGITIPVDEYSRLKDIETRFTIIKAEMLHAEYCPLHTKIILGIENVTMPEFLTKEFHIPEKEGE